MAEKKPEIILQFERLQPKAASGAPVPVSIHFDGADTEVLDFADPLTDKDLVELRWYLESYWQWPSDIDDERAREVEGKLPQWGKALFDAVFSQSSDAMRLFGRFDDDHSAGRVLTIDTTEPRILRLPWELLRDEGGYLFSKNPPVSILRRMHQTRRIQINAFEPPVRILMVSCRPDGAGFIDPRSVAIPLLDALDGIPEQVDVEFLRPPTLKALDSRLRDPARPRVHIVHFDGHGVYDRGIGLGFLLFEDEKHKKNQVDAEQLGTLLNESGIPLMVLNACQSAQPDERNPFASVASRLIESGVGGVVAMNYSVLVETAKRFTSEFYGALARGGSVSTGMDSARRSLFADTIRLTFTRPDQEEAVILHLQDWFLPALYQQADELIPFKPDGKTTALVKRAAIPQQEKDERGGFPPAPLHGFHGRARELLDLERAFATRRIVVLHGFGGQGKTALATQAAEWFTRTELFDRAVFVSFERGASLDFVLNELGNALVEENFEIHEGDKVDAIAQSLREKSALVVFDNFESALPGGNAPMTDLQALLDAAAKWFGKDGRSGLLITTRNPEIPHPACTPGKTCLRQELEGLAPGDALELAAAILEAHSQPRPPRAPLEALLDFLKGHPLSLQLALPQLRDYSAEQLVEQYQAILPTIKIGEGKERNESLEVSLRFSLDRLGAEAETMLTRLAVFEGGAMENALLLVTEIPEEKWRVLKPQLSATALIRVEEIPGVSVPFIHFHPTLAPYLRATMKGEAQGKSTVAPDLIENQQSEIESRYRQAYYVLANQLYRDDSQHPIEVRAIVVRELPNLRHALRLTVAAGSLDEAVDFADSINRFLDVFGRWREMDELTAETEKAVEMARGRKRAGEGITGPEFLMERARGERLMQQGRADEAERIFRALLVRLEGNVALDMRYEQVMTLESLGRCLSAQEHPLQAAELYRRAMGLVGKLNPTRNSKALTAGCHVGLADALTASGQYAQARQEYEIGLEIVREIEDDRDKAVILGQLGMLAIADRDLTEARERYTEALGLFQRMGEDQSEAIVWHQLGRVAQEAHDWDEAERCYRRSLSIKENLGDWALAATSCNQLAIIAEYAGRAQEAERWYLRAIELFDRVGDRRSPEKCYSNLAHLLLTQNRIDEADAYARRALEMMIKEALDPASQPWKTYNILARIAEQRGRAEEAREWRRKERESYAAFAGSDTEIGRFQTLIEAIVQAARGDAKAQGFLESEYPRMQASGGQWTMAAEAIKHLVAGERDLNALTEGLPRQIALVIIRALQALNGEPSAAASQENAMTGERRAVEGSPETATDDQPQPEGVTLPQLFELVERAAGGDRNLGAQLFPAMQKMATDPAAPPELQKLGTVLVEILAGARDPSLGGLPDELASAVRGLLGRLKNG